VGNSGGDVGEVAGTELDALATFNSTAANLAGSDRVSAGNGSACDERSAALAERMNCVA